MRPIRYEVHIPRPHTHLYHVEATVRGVGEDADVDMQLPAWTPGSYLIREYAQFVRDVEARDPDGNRLRVRKTGKTTWQVDTNTVNQFTLSYKVYGHDLGVRQNHLDEGHGFLNPPSTFMAPAGRIGDGAELRIHAPDGWRVWCALPRPEEAHDFFEAEDLDALYDAPLEMGPHESWTFEALGKEHELVVWGEPEFDVDKMCQDMKALVEANARMFGGELPYERYLTILLLTDGARGGLEHRDSTALMYPRDGFGSPGEAPYTDEKYVDFLTLFAHEHFHVWNVKRIRPVSLGPFDYTTENDTRDLWTIEGVTSYYQHVVMLRAGRISVESFLATVARDIGRLESIPGRFVDSLEAAGFDAWIKLYRSHENNLNATISYYLKGALISMLLDLEMRGLSGGKATLDDLMRHLWHQYSGESGYPYNHYEAAATELTDTQMKEFFETYVRGTDDPEWDDVFHPLGLTLEREREEGGWLGLVTTTSEGKVVVRGVLEGGPAAKAMISPGDSLVAIGGREVPSSGISGMLDRFSPGEDISVHLFRRGDLLERSVTVGERPNEPKALSVREDATDEERARLAAWIGDGALELWDKDAS